MVTAKSPKITPRKSTTTQSASSSVKKPDPEVVVNETPTVTAPELKKKELIDTVVARSGIKKRDAKPVIEAMLAVLGETISDGRELNLAPMGKLKITRMKKTTKAQVITARLRRNERAQLGSQSDGAVPVPAQAAE